MGTEHRILMYLRINSIFNLLTFFLTSNSKVIHVELPVDVLKSHLDINVENTVSSYLDIASSIDIETYDNFITEHSVFWENIGSPQTRALRFLLKLGWLTQDIKKHGMINPMQLLQTANGKYKIHPGAARAIVASYIMPSSTIKCYYVWDSLLDPNPFVLEYPHTVISNPFKFLKLFSKTSKFKIVTTTLTEVSTETDTIKPAKDGLVSAHNTFSLNFITTRDSSHWATKIRNKLFFKDIISFPNADTCILSGVKFIKINYQWIKE